MTSMERVDDHLDHLERTLQPRKSLFLTRQALVTIVYVVVRTP